MNLHAISERLFWSLKDQLKGLATSLLNLEPSQRQEQVENIE